MTQNKALRIATGWHQKAAASHLRAETGVLLVRDHLNYAASSSMLAPSNPVTSPTPSGLPSRPHTTAPSEAYELEVTTPPSSLGACWKRAPTWGRAGRGQMPPSRPDDRGDYPDPGAQQGVYGYPASNWPSRTTATSLPRTIQPTTAILAPFQPLLKASVLPSLRRLGRWPHLALHRPHGGPPL